MKKDTKTKDLATYDAEFAKHARAYKEQEASTLPGSFLSIRGGVLKYAGSPIKDNRMVVVVVDHVLENVYYGTKFDPDNPSPPLCYAFGRDEKTLAPHEKASDKQAEACARCAQNVFGSAGDGRRGKACSNVRRLALIPAGSFDDSGRVVLNEDPEHFASVRPAFLKVPVTSARAFALYVQQIADAVGRPPFGVYTKIAVVPDSKHSFSVTFEMAGKIGPKIAPIVLKLNAEMRDAISFAYPEQTTFDRGNKSSASKTKKTGARRPKF